ncbi:HPP family protein [bacterium]|nr:HPP family protein [bacterium]
MKLIDKKFKNNCFRYFFQCGIATITIVGILMYLRTVDHGAIIASLGASTFITFTMPHSYDSQVRRLLGGYLIGVSCGIVCYFTAVYAYSKGLLPSTDTSTVVFGGFAVGLAMFLMSIMNAEHAPAAGMALALVLNSWSGGTIVFIFASVAWLIFVKIVLANYLLDFRDLPIGSVNRKMPPKMNSFSKRLY